VSKLTQSTVRTLPMGQHHDDEVPGLRVVVGRRSASYKLVGRINDRSGRYVSIIVGRTDEISLKSARDKAHELRLAMRRGEDPRVKRADTPTVATAWARYLATRGTELRPRTVEFYREKVERSLSSIATVPMDRLDRETVRALHERLTARAGPYSANGTMRTLKMLYNDAARSHDLPPNPVTRGVRLNKQHARDWAISPLEMPAMWRTLDALADRTKAACWLTMLLTGLRRADAANVRWEHLDADGVLLVPSPKGGPDRSFRTPLPRLLLQEVERFRQETTPLGSPFLFPFAAGGKGRGTAMRRTDEFPYAPHQMRHTYRTFALEAGVDFQTVTLLMNHRPANVSWHYVTRAHLMGHMRQAQERIAEAISQYRGRSLLT
jgi:integrase